MLVHILLLRMYIHCAVVYFTIIRTSRYYMQFFVTFFLHIIAEYIQTNKRYIYDLSNQRFII